MALRVNNNLAAMNARRRLNENTRSLNLHLERLASGLRINKAADDPAGLSVREGMRAELSGLRQNVLNAEHASDLLQVAEGSLNEVNSIMLRMRTLAVQSANSTVTDSNRSSMQAEYTQLIAEIDRIAQSSVYNNQTLLTGFGNAVSSASTASGSASSTTGVTKVAISGAQAGTYSFVDISSTDNQITLGNGTVTQTIDIGTLLDEGAVATGTTVTANFDRLGIQVSLAGASVDGAPGSYQDGDLNGTSVVIEAGTGGTFQIGPRDGAVHRIEVSVADMRASGGELNLNTSSVSTISNAQGAITSVDSAINRVAQQRGDLGAFQNRLNFAISFTESSIENIQASEASISDADIAVEVSQFTRSQILAQTATAMMAQANVLPQNALALLR